MAEQIKGGLQGRIGLTLYYGFIFALAAHRCALIHSGRGVPDELSNFKITLYAAFALSGWWLLGWFRRMSDRIAAFLYGFFYAIRIGAHFIRSANALLVAEAGCVVISAGMIAIVVGLIGVIKHELAMRSARAGPSEEHLK